MTSVEVLIEGNEILLGSALLAETVEGARALGMRVIETNRYRGDQDWLCLWGVGHPSRDEARKQHIAKGGHVACWDLGYIEGGKDPAVSHARVSVDHNHPWRDFDRTEPDPSRLQKLSVRLRDCYDPTGPVIVIGMGPKSHIHLGLSDWELRTLDRAKARFPDRQVLYRPKPRRHLVGPTDWPLTSMGPIEEALNHASLVICRHSNVAVDACIAGIPVECEDGAAYWLYSKHPVPSYEQRLDFLQRLAWWQWRCNEQRSAWKFLQTIYSS